MLPRSRIPAAELAHKLAAPTGTPPLAELAKGRREMACVVISDITRPVPNRLILGQVLPILEAAGIARDKITILVATGLHRRTKGTSLSSLSARKSSIATGLRIITAPSWPSTRT